MRYFIQLDESKNVRSILASENTPGDDPEIVPDGILEVTDLMVDADSSPDVWMKKRLTDSGEFVDRTDMPDPVNPMQEVSDRLTAIEEAIANLGSNNA